MRIDSLHNKKKHIRHEVVRVTAGGWAHTRCGRKLIYYTKAENLSWFYTDGTRYAWPCRICCPEEYAALKQPICAECDSVIQPGERTEQRDDGEPTATGGSTGRATGRTSGGGRWTSSTTGAGTDDSPTA